jgi:hypothetical protein
LAATAQVLASRAMGWAVAASGALGLFCSVMIYVFTRRACWSFARTAVRFALTAALLGLTAVWLSVLLAALLGPTDALLALARRHGPALCQLIALVAAIKLGCEAALFRHLLAARMTSLRRSALLHVGELSSVTLARFALGLLGGLVMPWLLLRALPSLSESTLVAFTALTLLLFSANLAGELLERYLFFAACAAPRMPGGLR